MTRLGMRRALCAYGVAGELVCGDKACGDCCHAVLLLVLVPKRTPTLLPPLELSWQLPARPYADPGLQHPNVNPCSLALIYSAPPSRHYPSPLPIRTPLPHPTR